MIVRALTDHYAIHVELLGFMVQTRVAPEG